MKVFLHLAFVFGFLTKTSHGTETLCEKYSTAVFGDATGDDELALMEAVVNLATLGDASKNVPGILAADGGLLELFTGAGATTNRGGVAVKVNFLDGAGGLPDNLDPTSNTYFLLNHLYQFFGALLGCTADGFPSYEGVPDMYEVHKFMNVNKTQNDYFIAQVGAAATALGVTDDDVTTIAGLLDSVFNYRCTPPLTADSGVPDFLVGTDPSICQTSDCPVKDANECDGNPAPTPADFPTFMPEEDAADASGGMHLAQVSSTVIGACIMMIIFV